MFCEKCGIEISEKAHFCFKCGYNNKKKVK